MARPQSPGPVRGRAAANRHQLQRFLQRADWAFDVSPFSRKRLRHLVRFLPGVLGHPAGGRTHSHSPEKQGFSRLRPMWLAAPCEAKRRVAAPDFAPLFRSGLRSPTGSASKQSPRCFRSSHTPPHLPYLSHRGANPEEHKTRQIRRESLGSHDHRAESSPAVQPRRARACPGRFPGSRRSSHRHQPG